MELSTTIPTAKAIPASEMILILRPKIFKTIKSLKGFNKSIEHDSFEKSKKNADKPFQKYEFLGDRVLGLIISEYLITTSISSPDGSFVSKLVESFSNEL